jgi:hypothetical protein
MIKISLIILNNLKGYTSTLLINLVSIPIVIMIIGTLYMIYRCIRNGCFVSNNQF